MRARLRDDSLSDSSVRRDLRYMRDELHAPIIYDTKACGWKYARAYRLPLHHFTDDEVLALHLIQKLLAQHSPGDFLYKSFVSLLQKISPAEEFLRAEERSFYSRFFVPARPKMRIDGGVCEKVLRALRDNILLDFTYASRWEPEERHRRVLPYQLVLDEGSLYLYGAGREHKDRPRLFNLSRMRNVEVVPSCGFDLPGAFRFHEEFEKGRFGAFQYDEWYEFRIAFYGDARETVREYVWADDQSLLEDNESGSTTLAFTSSQWIPIRRWVLSFGADAEPLAPDWFVAEWRDAVRKMCGRL